MEQADKVRSALLVELKGCVSRIAIRADMQAAKQNKTKTNNVQNNL